MQKIKDALMVITEEEIKGLTKTELLYLQTNMESYINLYGNDNEFNKRVDFIQGLIDEKSTTYLSSSYQEEAKKYIGLPVKVVQTNQDGVLGRLAQGRIVGPSQAKNGSFVVYVNGENLEIHHENITDLQGRHLEWIP